MTPTPKHNPDEPEGTAQTRHAFELLYEIGIVSQLASTDFNRRMPQGLHVSHFTVLNHLARLGDGRTPLDLANSFQVSKANMTNTIARLLERGFIRLEPHPKDGRSKMVYLTDAGRACRLEAIAALEPKLESISTHESFATLMEALPALKALRASLDAARD